VLAFVAGMESADNKIPTRKAYGDQFSMKRRSYEERSDVEKIQSQWHKLTGLHSREEWSAAVVRAATAAEIAANFAVREEFKMCSKFDGEFVNSLLRWANGLNGKLNRLLLPLAEGKKAHA
jgi:hypothetical protein